MKNYARQKPVLGLKPTPVTKSVMSKLVPDTTGSQGVRDHGNGNFSPSPSTLARMSTGIAQSTNDAENIRATLPDVELAQEVLVSSIISPNDLRDAILTWESTTDELSSQLVGDLIKLLEDYFEKDYKISAILPKMLEEALFTSGSYPMVIVPESAIDDIINGNSKLGLEGFKSFIDERGVCKSRGLLGAGLVLGENSVPHRQTPEKKSFRDSMEDLFSHQRGPRSAYDSRIMGDDTLTITDNFEALRLPDLLDTARKSAVRRSVASYGSTGIESMEQIGARTDSMYRNRNWHGSEMIRVKSARQTSRAPIGHPLVLNAAADAVIPVHIPSNPETHLGYFLLLDDFGYLISNAVDSSYYQQMQNMNRQNDAASKLLTKSRLLQAAEIGNGANTLIEIQQNYARLVEQECLERLRNGVYGEAVEIPHVDEVYRIMFARALAGMNTQMLYVPEELVTYVAFDFNKTGIGRSLLERSKILAAVRSMLLFSNTMASIKNSVPRRKLTLRLPEDDMEYEKTIETMLAEYAKVQSSAMNFEVTAPSDIVDGIRDAATTVVVEGNPYFPEAAMELDDIQSQRAMIDSDFDEKTTKMHMQSFGLTPELVDSTADIEFATTQLNSSLLLTKRIKIYQDAAGGFLTDHVRKYTLNSGALLKDMYEIINKHQKDDTDSLNLSELTEGTDVKIDATVGKLASKQALHGTLIKTAKEEEVLPNKSKPKLTLSETVEIFLNSLNITLPPPDNTKLSNQMEQFSQYADALDAVLPAYINEDVLSETMGEENSDKAQLVLAVIRGYFLREFASKNSIMPELQKLVNTNSENEGALNLLEEYQLHADGLVNSVGSLIKAIIDRNNSGGEDEDADEDDDADYGGSASDDSDSADTDSADAGGAGDDDFGGDDFGGDFGDDDFGSDFDFGDDDAGAGDSDGADDAGSDSTGGDDGSTDTGADDAGTGTPEAGDDSDSTGGDAAGSLDSEDGATAEETSGDEASDGGEEVSDTVPEGQAGKDDGDEPEAKAGDSSDEAKGKDSDEKS